jgi:hypothetical protein
MTKNQTASRSSRVQSKEARSQHQDATPGPRDAPGGGPEFQRRSDRWHSPRRIARSVMIVRRGPTRSDSSRGNTSCSTTS